MADLIYYVIPCYNEEAVLPLTAKKIGSKLLSQMNNGLAARGSRILFVDDGSKDSTWKIIETLSERNALFTGLKLSGNRGHQYALFAGLMTAKKHADAVISMDADLQDDVDASNQFLNAYYKGCEIVYGVRKNRKKDTFFKRTTAEGFYRLMNTMGVHLVFNHADYRLMSRKALDCLQKYGETNLFLRGIVPQIGLKSTCVFYERGTRAAGKSKYSLAKMLAFAFEGMTSFSIKPIRLVFLLGCIVLCTGVGLSIVAAATGGRIFAGQAVLLCSLWLLAGAGMLSLGLVGEYIGKIYAEVKRRPRYIIEKDLSEKTQYAEQAGNSADRQTQFSPDESQSCKMNDFQLNSKTDAKKVHATRARRGRKIRIS